MKIEVTYNNGMSFTACFSEKTYEDVLACVMDDVSVAVMHDMGRTEEDE